MSCQPDGHDKKAYVEYIAQNCVYRFFYGCIMKRQEGAPKCGKTIQESTILISAAFNNLKEKENEPRNNPDKKEQKDNPQQGTLYKG